MKCPPEYWIWLQRTLGAGSSVGEVLDFFENPERLYAAGRGVWRESGVFNKKHLDKLITCSPSQSYNIMKQCSDNGWHIIVYDDERFPSLLRKINNPPLVLYVQGNPEVLVSDFAVGIVGTRLATDYGKTIAGNLAYELASAGCTIVSGGALGIDSCAHAGALRAGGKTIAFLGSGLGCEYLRSNEQLRQSIAKTGAVVSEFAPFSEPTRYTFPIRNRLISGMSHGVVVVEASEKSGSLITANCAMEQGRDVFAVPGNIFNSNYIGTNNLIRDGAKVIFSAKDILDGYIDFYGKYLDISKCSTVQPSVSSTADSSEYEKIPAEAKLKDKKPSTVKKTQAEVPEGTINGQSTKASAEIPDYATDNAKKLFSVMTTVPETTDGLIMKTNMSVQDVVSALTELEMYCVVVMHSGKRYSL